MTQTDTRIRFDQQMYQAALAFYGLPADYMRVFKSVHAKDPETGEPLYKKNGQPDTYLTACHPKESLLGNTLWVQVNQPREDTAFNGKGRFKKAENGEIGILANITLDYENAPDPRIARDIGNKLNAYLISQGWAMPGTPVEDSGAGPHHVLPIPPIAITNKEAAERWNRAIETFVVKYVKPEFQRLCAASGIEMEIGSYDISRILSVPGTWRPTNPTKQDCAELQDGYLRRWLPPYTDGHYPLRQECQQLRNALGDIYEITPAVKMRVSSPSEIDNGWDYDTWHAWLHTNYDVVAVNDDGSIDIICPWVDEHTTPGDIMRVFFGPPHTVNCFHDHCKGKRTWGDLRAKVDPNYRREQWQDSQPEIPPSSNGNGASSKNKTTSRRPEPLTPRELETPQVLYYLSENEYGDARFLAEAFAGQVCYDHTEKEWYLWHGHYWKRDATEQTNLLVAGALGTLYLKASAELNTTQVALEKEIAPIFAKDAKDPSLTPLQEQHEQVKQQRGALADRAKALRSNKRTQNVMAFMQSLMGVTSDIWDKDTWLLACPNGVIDQRTGECHDGDPEDYIRTVCPTEWKGLYAPCPRWERFLQEIFEDRVKGGDTTERDELIDFVQRKRGYDITGDTRHHIFEMLYGEEGRNGKGKMIGRMKKVLGPYVGAVSKDVLVATNDKFKQAGAATPHLSDLQGKRMVWCSETKQGDKLNVAQIKELTGEDEIATRGVYSKHYTRFFPTHKLVLMTNHKPHAEARDKPFWTRVCLIEFNMRFVSDPQEPNERPVDLTLDAELDKENSGILAWLVRGCLEWQQRGLDFPESVKVSVQKYQEEEDTLGQFIKSQCVTGQPNLKAYADQLYRAYETWCDANKLSTGSHKCVPSLCSSCSTV